MAYRRSRVNIRRAPRRRRVTRRAPVRRRTYTRRRTYARRGKVAQPCKCPGELTPGDKFVMLQADPFDTKYFGAKIPDSSTIPSIATPVQYNYPLTTAPASQPNFAHAWGFVPGVESCNVAYTGTSVSAWNPLSTVTSDAPMRDGFCSNFEAYRPTAHAIRLSCPYAPTTTTGFVHIALATETVYANDGSLGSGRNQIAANLSEMSNYTFYKRVTLASLTQSPITLINKWTDETAFRYQSPAPAVFTATDTIPNAFHIPFSWGVLLVAVEGVSTVTTAGSITPLQAEVILHSEGIPNKSSTLIGSTAAAYSSSVLNAVSQAVAQTDMAHTEEQQQQHVASYAQAVGDAIGMSEAEVNAMGRSIMGHAVRFGIGYVTRNYGPGLPGVNNTNRLALT